MFAQYLALFTALNYGKTPDNPFPPAKSAAWCEGVTHLPDGQRMMSRWPRYLGVDGGGSKTAFALIDDTGHVAGPRRHGGDLVLLQRRLSSVVERVLAQGVADICGARPASTPADIDAAFFGLPGYGEASARSARRSTRHRAAVLGHDRYSLQQRHGAAAGPARWARSTASTSSAAPAR